MFGIGQDKNMFLGSLINSLLDRQTYKMTLGEQWRSFISVSTLCDIIERSIELKNRNINLLNVSSPAYIQIRDLALMVQKIVGYGDLSFGSVPYREYEIWHQRPSLKLLHDLWPDLSFPDFESEIKKMVVQEKSLHS